LPGELFSNTIKNLVEVFSADAVLRDNKYDVAFGHEANTNVAAMLARLLNLPYGIYFATMRGTATRSRRRFRSA